MPDSPARAGVSLAASVGGSVVGASVGLLLAGPPGALIGAAAAPAATEVLRRVGQEIAEWRNARAANVLELASDELGITPDALVERLRSDPAREELLLRTLRAAQDAGMAGKLVLLARSLAVGAESSAGEVLGETAFVRSLDDCDIAHVLVLDAFTRTPNELGLGDGGPDFDRPASGELNTAQLAIAYPDLSTHLDHLLATLQRNGLVASRTGASGFAGMFSDGSIEGWNVTALGLDFLRRLRALGHDRE